MQEWDNDPNPCKTEVQLWFDLMESCDQYAKYDILSMKLYHYESYMTYYIIRPSTNYWGSIVTIAIIVVICGLAAIAYQDIAS